MNWLSRLGSVIGYFWQELFRDSSLVRAIKMMHGLAGRAAEDFLSGRLSWRMAAEPYPVPSDRLPVRVLMKVATTVRKGTLSLGSSQSLGAGAGNSWALELLWQYPGADYLTNRLFDPDRTLLRGADYTVSGSSILFNSDPATLGFSTVTQMDASGASFQCYVAYGWKLAATAPKDAVSGIYGGNLTGVSDVVWEMHVKGATKLSVLRLLAWSADAVLCLEGGPVEARWSEGPSSSRLNCIRIAGRVYSSRKAQNATPESGYVPSGFVLFGDMAIYDGKTAIPGASIPSMSVMTDAGEVTAPNSSRSSVAITEGGSIIGYSLSVTGSNSAAYAAKCGELLRGGGCPVPATPVGAVENPLMYIAGTLRRGRGLFVRLGEYSAGRLSAAVNVIRKGALALGSINIYTTAYQGTTSVPVSASATVA